MYIVVFYYLIIYYDIFFTKNEVESNRIKLKKILILVENKVML